MSKLNLFPENISTSKAIIFAFVLITSLFFPFLVNLLFLNVQFTNIMKDKSSFVLIGLLIYGGWLAFLFFLYRKDRIQLKDLTITRQKFASGLVAGLYVFIIVNLILYTVLLINKNNVSLSEDFSSISLTVQTLGLFIFNILIGAFIEEVIFRAYLIPQVFNRIKNKVGNSIISLIITILITQALFTISHIFRDLFRNNYDFQTITNDFKSLFESGIILSLIFLWTKNIFFITISHSFMNFSLAISSSPYFTSYASIATIIVALLWYKITAQKEKREIATNT